MNALMRWYRDHFARLGETAQRVIAPDEAWEPEAPVLVGSRCARRSGRLGWMPHTDLGGSGRCAVCHAPVRR